MVGTLALPAVFLASTLFPSDRIIFGEGPTKIILCFAHSSANSGFSDKKPYPGWMASQPELTAICTIPL